MAEVYRRPLVNGKPMKLSKVIALHEDVQRKLAYVASYRAARAQLILKRHVHSGDSFIEMVHGRVDYNIVLNDTNGQRAAMTIEFGRNANSRTGPSEAVAPLRKGTGLL